MNSESADARGWHGTELGTPGRGRALSPERVAVGAGLALLLLGAGIAKLFEIPPALPGAPAPAAAVAPEGSEGEAAGAASFTQRRAFSLAGIDGIETALTDLGLDAAAVSGIAEAARAGVGVEPGEIVLRLDLVETGNEVRLTRLGLSRDDGRQGVVVPAGAGYQGSPVEAQLSRQLTPVRGEMGIEDFYSAAVQAGLPDVLIPRFAAALAFDFDFQREVRPGDVFEAAFERQVDTAGRPVGQPDLVYVSLRTNAKSRALYAFRPAGEEVGWFDGNGASAIRALMRTPVDGARVSSQFGFRVHPIRGYRKLHRGTDFAAPTGTPIFAAAGGTVNAAGYSGGAGNRVMIDHDNGWQTRYFHLVSFAPGLAAGNRVGQGQSIGKVGSTGASTGPHLHYEVHIKGEPVNPMEIETGSGRKLEGALLGSFYAERDRIDAGRAAGAR